MTANVSALKIRIFIGADNLEFTEQLTVFSVGYTKRDRSGIIFTEGSITLADTVDPSRESLNVRKNPDRWKRGNRVLIQIETLSGAWVTHPLGLLYIIKEPIPPHPDNPTITLQLGCILRLRDYKEPDEDASNVELGTSTTRGLIVKNILERAGITFNETINSYPLDAPLPKQNGGSFVAQAGEIAYGALVALYQDNTGVIRIVDLSVVPKTPILTIGIGNVYQSDLNEISYEPLASEETPVDELEVSGDKKASTELQNSITTESYFYANAGILGGEGEGVIVARFVRRSEQFTQYIRTIQEETYEPKGILNTESFPGDSTLVLSEKATERYFYDGNEQNKLNKIIRSAFGWLPGKLATYYNSVDEDIRVTLNNAYANYETVTEYKYDLTTEITTEIKITNKIPLGAIVSDEPEMINAGSAVDESITVTRWKNLGHENYYQKIVSVQRAAALVGQVNSSSEDLSTRINAKKGLITAEYTTSVSNSGQNNPPAAERGQPNLVESEEPLKGTAKFKTSGTAEQNRKRSITINYVSSQDQLNKIAAIEGAVLIGKRIGQRFQIPFDEKFLDRAEPLVHILSIEPDATSYQFIADGIEYTHTQNEALIGFDGIWIANLPPTTNESVNSPGVYDPLSLQPPYNSVVVDLESFNDVMIRPPNVSRLMFGGLVVGGELKILPYSIEPKNLNLNLGLIVGGGIIAAKTIKLFGGSIVGGEIDFVRSGTQLRSGVLVGGTVDIVKGVKLTGGLVIGGFGKRDDFDKLLFGGLLTGGSTDGYRGIQFIDGLIVGGFVRTLRSVELYGGSIVGGNVAEINITYSYSQSSKSTNGFAEFANNTNMTDGDNTTGTYTNDSTDEWVKVTYNVTVRRNTLDIGAGTITNVGGTATSIGSAVALQYSNDDVNWFDVIPRPQLKTLNDTINPRQKLGFPERSARYWRLKKTGTVGFGITQFLLEDNFYYYYPTSVYSVNTYPQIVNLTGTFDRTTGGITDSNTNQAIILEYRDPHTATQVTLGGGSVTFFGGIAAYLNGCLFQYSTDGVNWTTLFTVSGVVDTVGSELKTFTFAETTAKYWRIFRSSSNYVATTFFAMA